MKLRIASDLHSEFARKAESLDNILPVIEDEANTVLVLAGDIIGYVNDKETVFVSEWLTDLIERHYFTVYVPGNHEGYGSSYNNAHTFIQNLMQPYADDGKAAFLNNEMVQVGDVMFYGTTLWTPLNAPMDTMYLGSIADLKVEGFDFDKWRQYHNQSVYFLETAMAMDTDCKRVVVTHHAPSHMSIAPQYIGKRDNCGYASNQERFMLEHPIALWVHGHTHTSFDYTVDDYDEVVRTRVICNPRGYMPEDLNRDYNPAMIVEV